MDKFAALVAQGQALRAAKPVDNRTIAQKIAALAESARKQTIIACNGVEDVTKRSASQYLDIREAMKKERMAKGYRW